ncbi:hypothetical protein [Pedobacter sp. UBA5917]|jgi:hypothetical protein|uniref:hypothetical protein n=1 Tax=Pedobacter sp. UBA5917 TaxID=1947061 RepID=UPI0025E5DDEF|nr:hypothetical protein [Pedobacter sp. UBA5917]
MKEERILLTSKEKFTRMMDAWVKLGELCKLYDDGNTTFYTEIATKIRSLFHETRISKSLVGQVLDLEGRYLLSTGRNYDPNNLAQHTPLINFKFRGELHPVYSHNKPPFVFERKLIFGAWWNKELVYVDHSGNKFTRQKIVSCIADTDGGAHYDPSLPKDYYEVSRKNSLGYTYYKGMDPTDKERNSMGDPLISTLRTIAEEVLLSMHPENQTALHEMPISEE